MLVSVQRADFASSPQTQPAWIESILIASSFSTFPLHSRSLAQLSLYSYTLPLHTLLCFGALARRFALSFSLVSLSGDLILPFSLSFSLLALHCAAVSAFRSQRRKGINYVSFLLSFFSLLHFLSSLHFTSLPPQLQETLSTTLSTSKD